MLAEIVDKKGFMKKNVLFLWRMVGGGVVKSPGNAISEE